MDRHPETGIHYYVSIPSAAAFYDINDAYRRAAASRPWMTVITQDQFLAIQMTQPWVDPHVCFVLWHGATEIRTKDTREAKVVEFYVEAIGDQKHMLGRHVDHFNAFVDRREKIDAVFTHTPRMCLSMESLGMQAHVVPAGWDPSVAVRVEKKLKKHAVWGSEVGVRVNAIAALQKIIPDSIVSLTGRFGSDLTRELSGVSAALYIPHSEVWSFSTWRIWQSVAAGTPMVIPTCVSGENLDCWPMKPEQCVTLPWSYSDPAWSAEHAAKDLMDILDHKMLSTARENMLDELASEFTTAKVIDEWLVPACAAVRR